MWSCAAIATLMLMQPCPASESCAVDIDSPLMQEKPEAGKAKPGPMANGQLASAKGPGPSEKVKAPDSAAVKRAVFSAGVATAVPRHGKFADLTVLIVPKEIVDLYATDPKLVLDTLKDIVKGSRPDDAVFAAGLYFALTEDPTKGYAYLMTGTKGFDELEHKGATQTPRDFLLSRMKK